MKLFFKVEYILFLLFILIVPSLVSGPAIPDIILTLISIYGLFKISYLNDTQIEIKKIIFFLIFFNCIFFFSSIISAYQFHSLSSSVFYIRFIFFSLGAYVLIKEVDIKFLKYFFIVSIFTLLFVGFDSLKQFIYGSNFFGMVPDSIERPSGLFGEELKIGHFLARLLPVIYSLLYFFYFKKEYAFKFFIGSSILLLLFNFFVLISGERTSLLLILLFDIIFYLSIPINKKIKIAMIIISILFFIIAIFYIDTVRIRIITETYNQIFNGEKTYFFSEQYHSHYLSAIKMFLENLIFGIGPNNFRYSCQLEQYYINELHCSTHPHNTLIQLLAEIGLVGGIFFIFIYTWMIYKLFNSLYNKYSKKDNLDFAKIYIISSFIINFFPFLPSLNFFNNWINVIYYIPLPIYFYINHCYNVK